MRYMYQRRTSSRFLVVLCVLVVLSFVGAWVWAMNDESEGSDLRATLKGPDSVPVGKPINVRFTLLNDADVSLYVLKWYTPLEGVAGGIFRVECEGQELEYEGILAMRGHPSPECYVKLEPGAEVSAEVDLSQVYDFSRPGEYTIEFLSPGISHLTRTEDGMASMVEDLCPVEIPSNSIKVEVN